MEGTLLLAIMTSGNPFGHWMFPHGRGCLGGGRVRRGILPVRMNIARRLQAFGMACDICECVEEFDVHVLLECPLAERIWSATSVDKGIWGGWFKTA